jgi:hypothetical protein
MGETLYLNEVFPDFAPIFQPFKGHPWAGRDAMGYGRRIPTDYMVKLKKRLYRVYACCFGNAGTLYIVTKSHSFLVVLDGDLAGCRENLQTQPTFSP